MRYQAELVPSRVESYQAKLKNYKVRWGQVTTTFSASSSSSLCPTKPKLHLQSWRMKNLPIAQVEIGSDSRTSHFRFVSHTIFTTFQNLEKQGKTSFMFHECNVLQNCFPRLSAYPRQSWREAFLCWERNNC